MTSEIAPASGCRELRGAPPAPLARSAWCLRRRAAWVYPRVCAGSVGGPDPPGVSRQPETGAIRLSAPDRASERNRLQNGDCGGQYPEGHPSQCAVVRLGAGPYGTVRCQRGGESRRPCKADHAGSQSCRWLHFPAHVRATLRSKVGTSRVEGLVARSQAEAVFDDPTRAVLSGLGVKEARLSYTQKAREHYLQPVPSWRHWFRSRTPVCHAGDPGALPGCRTNSRTRGDPATAF